MSLLRYLNVSIAASQILVFAILFSITKSGGSIGNKNANDESTNRINQKLRQLNQQFQRKDKGIEVQKQKSTMIRKRSVKKLLQICETVCYSSDDCEDSLKCYTRNTNVNIPGCAEAGWNEAKENFCYDPNYNGGGDYFMASGAESTVEPTYIAASLNGSAWVARDQSEYPLQKCQGHCTDRKDCDDGLECYQRATNEFFVPGCMGKADLLGTNYCYDPNDMTLYTPAPTNSPTRPPTAIPTWAPRSQAPTRPPTRPPTWTPRSQAPTRLPTLAPVTTGPTFPPISVFPTHGPTIVPTRQLTSVLAALTEPGNDGFPESAFPLERCQGDCDGDSDCAPGLLCFFRDGFTPVPGCSGSGLENTDYCIDKRDDPAKPPVVGAFRIKLYWEKGYNWQDTYREANWCIQCLNPACYGDTIDTSSGCLESVCDINDILTLRPCGVENTFFEYTDIFNGTVKSVSELDTSYTNLRGAKYDKFVQSYNRQVAQAYFQFTRAQYEYYGNIEPVNRTYFVLPEELRNGSEAAFNKLVANDYFDYTKTVQSANLTQLFHLRIATSGNCLELVNARRIEVQPCDYTSDRQKFGPGDGNFFGARFELSPLLNGGCLTNPHHPRDYEMLYREECERARFNNASYYNRY